MQELLQQIEAGKVIDRLEAYEMIQVEPKSQMAKQIIQTAERLTRQVYGQQIDLCSIVSVKSGKCTEDCHFCAQSVHFSVALETYDVMPFNEVFQKAEEMAKRGVHRYSMVSSGRGPSTIDLDTYVDYYEQLGKIGIQLCASHGILNHEEAVKLKNAGVKRYHHNLETSERFYQTICTTHSYQERIETIKSAKKAGLEVCSGGIFGLGETLKDRVDLAFTLKDLSVDSVPLNVLNPIQGTPLADVKLMSAEEILLSIAVMRLILPKTSIRVAGGRGLLGTDQWQVLKSGADGLMVGNYLTTDGGSLEEDLRQIREMDLLIS